MICSNYSFVLSIHADTMKYLSHAKHARLQHRKFFLSLDGFLFLLMMLALLSVPAFCLSVQPWQLSLFTSATRLSVYSKQTLVAASCLMPTFFSTVCDEDLHAAAEQMREFLNWEESHIFSMFICCSTVSSKGIPLTSCSYNYSYSFNSRRQGSDLEASQVKNAAYLTFRYNQQHLKLCSISPFIME